MPHSGITVNNLSITSCLEIAISIHLTRNKSNKNLNKHSKCKNTQNKELVYFPLVKLTGRRCQLFSTRRATEVACALCSCGQFAKVQLRANTNTNTNTDKIQRKNRVVIANKEWIPINKNLPGCSCKEIWGNQWLIPFWPGEACFQKSWWLIQVFLRDDRSWCFEESLIFCAYQC